MRLGRQQALERELVMVVGAPRAPVGMREIERETARRPAIGPRRRANRYRPAAMDRNRQAVELVLERFILERRAGWEAAAIAIGLGGQRQRGPAEVMVFGQRAVDSKDPIQALACTPLALAQRRGRESGRLVDRQLDQTADRARAATGER